MSQRPALTLISSMATKHLLADLTQRYAQETGQAVEVVSVGGVDAAKRVRAGEAFDIVMLARNAIDSLAQEGHLVGESTVDVVSSGVAVAVKSGATPPDLSSEIAVRQAVAQAPSLSYSTGPSGVALQQLFERWGLAEALKDRLVQAPAGVPVGSLVAEGRVALGFQQLSELIALPGIDVVGPLPPDIQITTVFSAAQGSGSPNGEAVRAFLAFLRHPATRAAKQAQGMDAA